MNFPTPFDYFALACVVTVCITVMIYIGAPRTINPDATPTYSIVLKDKLWHNHKMHIVDINDNKFYVMKCGNLNIKECEKTWDDLTVNSEYKIITTTEHEQNIIVDNGKFMKTKENPFVEYPRILWMKEANSDKVLFETYLATWMEF